jgi:formylglycine-generating enzyme required for sulfatase activity
MKKAIFAVIVLTFALACTAPSDMALIQGGTFTMGSPANEIDRDDDEVQHSVMVSSFYMGKYEVTQKKYREVMGINPISFKEDNLPVEGVTWFNAVEFCNRLSLREGLLPAYTVNGTDVTEYTSEAQSDPAGASSGYDRTIRGGSWLVHAQFLRSANRFSISPSRATNAIGFRLALSVF